MWKIFHIGKDREKPAPAIASRVGLGSGRTYEKAAKVVRLIDEEAEVGHLEIAQALRKVLNEQSVDAAHTLFKKSPQERSCIADLIVNGLAKSVRQAQQMVRQKTHFIFNDPRGVTYAGFSVGDRVEVNSQAQSFTIYIGQRGQVEQVWPAEQQIIVNLEGGPSKIRFYPHELTMIALAPPPNPFRVGDIVFVDIDRREAASVQEKRWNGFWGKITQIGEMGSLTVDIGSYALQLFPRDLKPIDAQGSELRQVVERVLRLRRFELDPIEQTMLDVLQQREWFTPKQLIYLGKIEQHYPDPNFN